MENRERTLTKAIAKAVEHGWKEYMMSGIPLCTQTWNVHAFVRKPWHGISLRSKHLNRIKRLYVHKKAIANRFRRGCCLVSIVIGVFIVSILTAILLGMIGAGALAAMPTICYCVLGFGLYTNYCEFKYPTNENYIYWPYYEAENAKYINKYETK